MGLTIESLEGHLQASLEVSGGALRVLPVHNQV